MKTCICSHTNVNGIYFWDTLKSFIASHDVQFTSEDPSSTVKPLPPKLAQIHLLSTEAGLHCMQIRSYHLTLSLKFKDTLTWCHFEVIHCFSHDVWTGDADREEKKGCGFVLTSCLASKADHCKWGKPAAPGAGANGEDAETPLCPTTCLRPSASSICTPKAHRAVQRHPQVPPFQGRSVSQACHWYHLQSKCLQKSSWQENPWIRHTVPTKQWSYSNTNHNPTSQPTYSFLLDLIT